MQLVVEADLKKFARDIKKRIQSATVNDLKAIARFTINMVRVRTRLGWSVARNGGRRKRFEKLSPEYAAFRNDHATSAFARRSGRGSNLTFTGQMLRAFKVLRLSRKSLTIGIAATSRRDTSADNANVADFVSKRRPFMNLSDLEIKKLARFVDRKL